MIQECASQGQPSQSLQTTMEREQEECTQITHVSKPKRYFVISSALYHPFYSNSVSDNFVRVNLKVKRYSRTARRVTGSRYKRQQWRKRQKDEEGGEGGSKRRKSSKYSCFKCGKVGHWAKNCTERGSCKDLGTFDGEEVTYSDDIGGVFEEGGSQSDLEEMEAQSLYPSVEGVALELKKKQNARAGTDDGDGERENDVPDDDNDAMELDSHTPDKEMPTNTCLSPHPTVTDGPTDDATGELTVEPYLVMQDGRVSDGKCVLVLMCGVCVHIHVRECDVIYRHHSSILRCAWCSVDCSAAVWIY